MTFDEAKTLIVEWHSGGNPKRIGGDLVFEERTIRTRGVSVKYYVVKYTVDDQHSEWMHHHHFDVDEDYYRVQDWTIIETALGAADLVQQVWGAAGISLAEMLDVLHKHGMSASLSNEFSFDSHGNLI